MKVRISGLMKGWCSTLEKIINDADGVLDNFHLPQTAI